MYWGAIFGITSAFVLGLALAISPRSKLYDRILAVNYLGTLIVLFIAVIGFVNGRPDFLDIAILYALINFVGTIAILRYLHPEDLSVSESRSYHDEAEQ